MSIMTVETTRSLYDRLKAWCADHPDEMYAGTRTVFAGALIVALIAVVT